MKTLLPVLLAVLAATAVGCRKKSPVDLASPPAPAPAPIAAPEGTPANPGNAAETAYSNATILTMMLQEYVATNKRLPTNLKELETIKTFGAVPPPPPGFRYVIDGANKRVVAQKQ